MRRCWSTERKRERTETLVRQKTPQGRKKRSGGEPRGKPAATPFFPTEWLRLSQPEHLLKQHKGESPYGLTNSALSKSHADTLRKKQLQTVHPNPGPRRAGRRGGRSEEEREARRSRRYEKRKVRRKEKEKVGKTKKERRGEFVVTTWNVQRMTLRENNRRRLRRVLDYIERRNWQIVLLSEIKADSNGILWLGEEERLIAVVHSKKTAICLRGGLLKEWISEGKKRSYSERTTSVSIRDTKFVSAYQRL